MISNRSFDTDYADDLVLLVHTPAQVESLLHSPVKAIGGIGLFMNADKIQYMCFKQKGTISSLSSKPLK